MKRMQSCLPLVAFFLALLSGLVGAAAYKPVSVEQVVEKYRSKVEARLVPRFRYAGVDWPPLALQLLAIKDTRRMELWARSERGWHFIRDYRIKGMSGVLGPKLKEGDRQVPEGIYSISRLNPNSSFHLSLKVDYPNAYDRKMAKNDGRRQLGGDIFIHGNQVSRGCLAIGDNAIEELFILSALLGKEQVGLLISPVDFRTYSTESLLLNDPQWVGELHREISVEMRKFQRQQH
ncbi:MAG: L,D-transpeptidase family protein [Gammaproteobacteria bacterium]|nr:L,D-transpeptidase family protein [Gammaproteobacteria bacterium]